VVLPLLVCAPLLVSRVKELLTPLPLHDFVTYWAAGRLFLSGGDPYSISATFAIERSLGWIYAQPLMMVNPPYALLLVTPLAMVPFQVAHYGCFAVSLVIEVVCSLALWRYFGGERRLQWIALGVLVTFLPAASSEHYGQVTPLMLGGMTGFLWALRKKKDVLAGACLVLLGLKPHLLYLVLLAILLWSIQSKKWQIPTVALLCSAGASLGAIVYNRNVAGYFRGALPAALEMHCGLGGGLRLIFGLQHEWLQFVPCVFGGAWFPYYWMRHRRTWTWEDQLPLLLLVSIESAAYFWMEDYILALPAVIALAIYAERARALPVVATLYVVIQMIVVNAGDSLRACAASALWIVLYGVVQWMGVPAPPRADEVALGG